MRGKKICTFNIFGHSLGADLPLPAAGISDVGHLGGKANMGPQTTVLDQLVCVIGDLVLSDIFLRRNETNAVQKR